MDVILVSGSLQVAWLVNAEMLPWSDGIGRQFHRPKKTQVKLNLAFEEVRQFVVLYICRHNGSRGEDAGPPSAADRIFLVLGQSRDLPRLPSLPTPNCLLAGVEPLAPSSREAGACGLVEQATCSTRTLWADHGSFDSDPEESRLYQQAGNGLRQRWPAWPCKARQGGRACGQARRGGHSPPCIGKGAEASSAATVFGSAGEAKMTLCARKTWLFRAACGSVRSIRYGSTPAETRLAALMSTGALYPLPQSSARRHVASDSACTA